MADERPKIKNLLDGVIVCAGCGSKISMSDYEPLEIAECPDCSAPNFIPMRLKDYWLFKPLGGGGMGSVYQAVCESAKGDFAVKILPRKLKSDRNLINNLMREGEIGKIIGKHPNIVALVDYGVEGDEHFIITQFAEGTRLDILISSAGQLSERQSIDILKQVLEAEIHIKNCGFLFRDIKPENIMIMKGKKTVVKLYDFGLCLSLADAANPDPNDSLEGSPFYLPPERIVAAPEGEYSEVYSLGMLFFHMLTGTTYFSQSDIKELMGKHVTSLRMASVSNRLKHCSPEVAAVVDKMIKRNPNDRYPDFDSLKAALEPLKGDAAGFPLQQEEEAIDEGDAPIDDKTPATAKNNSKLITILALVVALAVAGGFAFWIYSDAQREKKLLRELRVKEAAKLGISPDVAPPDKTETQLYMMIDKRRKEIIAEATNKLPKFDAKTEREKIIAKYKLSGFVGKKPLPLAEAKKLVAKKIDDLIKKELAKTAKPFPEKLVAQMVANRLKIKLPVAKPDISLKELEKRVEAEIMKLVKEKYPPGPLTKKISKILKKYKFYRKGDRVAIPTKAGGTLKGIYQGRRGRYIIIDGADVAVADLPPSVRIKFNPALVAKKTKMEVARAKRLFEEKRKAFKKPLYDKEFPKQAAAHGYVLFKKRWVPAADLFNAMLAKERKKYEEKQTKKQIAMIEKMKKKFDASGVYRSFGYVKQGKKYIPIASFIDSELKKRKRAFDTANRRKISAITPKAMKQAQEEVYKAHGYVYAEDQWQPASDLLKRRVHNAYVKMCK